MESENNKKQLVFTSDKPVLEDQLGTHKHLANLLVQIVKSESDNPLVVGLFGGWGTGKSSIVKMYEEIAKEHNIKNVYLDAWLFSSAKERFGAGLLRVLAYEILPWHLRKKFLSRIDKKTETWETKRSIGVGTWAYLIVVLLFMFALVYQAITGVGLNNGTALGIVISLIVALVINGLFEFVLPKTMTTSESRTSDDSYNKVEHFTEEFKGIVAASFYKTISLVVDNLDRVEPVDGLEMIRMLKSFVCEDDLCKKRLVLIVPCDEQELARHIEKQLYVENAHEFLQKFFNISIPVPELVHEDIVAFAKNELDKVLGSLHPSLTENDASLVSFVISRAARRNPRQIKALINSFASYWQSAGLVGTAGLDRGISPLGSVIYICLSYLKGREELPGNIDEVFSLNSKNLKEFLDSIREFQNQISNLEWSYLRRLQISENERVIPNFVDIYFAVTDLKWATLDELITDNYDLADLISRLDIKVREEDNISRERFYKWVLSLFAEQKLTTTNLPLRVKSSIDFVVSRYENDWKPLVDEGLVEYLVQKPYSQGDLFKILENLKITAETGKISKEEVRFIVRTINSSTLDYWINTSHHDALMGALDGIIYHYMPKADDEFFNLLLRNLQVVVFDGTGVRLADELANRVQKEGFKDFALLGAFENVQEENVGAFSFAGHWLQLTPFSTLTNTVEKILFTLQSIEALLDLDNVSRIQQRLPSVNHLEALINALGSNSGRRGNSGSKKEIEYGAVAMILLSFLAEKLKFPSHTAIAQNTFRDTLFPALTNQFEQFDNEDKVLFVKYLDKYPKILNFVQAKNLAAISKNEDLQILSRIIDNSRQLDEVLSELISHDFFIKVLLASSIDKKSGKPSIDLRDKLVSSVFRVLENNSWPEQKYREILGLKKLFGNKVLVNDLVKKHMLWLINRANWNEKKSVETTVNKIKALEEVVSIDDEVKKTLRGKIDPTGVDILKSILSDDTRAWITAHLAQ
jgi:hypothetical protein